MRAKWRRLSGAATSALVLAGVLLLAFGSAPAAAHAALEKTAPADGSTVSTAPASVSLTFDEAPQTEFSAIHVTGPDGQRKDSGPVTLAGTVVSETLTGSRPAGRYVVDWRVVSDDGHPVSGQFAFTVTSGAPQVVARPATADPAPAKSSNTAVIVISVIAGLLVVAGIVAFVTWRRRRSTVHE